MKLTSECISISNLRLEFSNIMPRKTCSILPYDIFDSLGLVSLFFLCICFVYWIIPFFPSSPSLTCSFVASRLIDFTRDLRSMHIFVCDWVFVLKECNLNRWSTKSINFIQPTFCGCARLRLQSVKSSKKRIFQNIYRLNWTFRPKLINFYHFINCLKSK